MKCCVVGRFFGGFGSPPKQMVGILMTHQHGPLDFDQTATIIITFSGTLLFVAVGSNPTAHVRSNGPCWWVMRIPHHLLRRESKSLFGHIQAEKKEIDWARNKDKSKRKDRTDPKLQKSPYHLTPFDLHQYATLHSSVGWWKIRNSEKLKIKNAGNCERL